MVEEKRNILVFRIGSLGDSIVAVPSFWALREAFPTAEFTLFCDVHPESRYVLAADLLKESGLIDHVLTYTVRDGLLGRIERLVSAPLLARSIRGRKFDAVVYLPPSQRTPAQIKRDRRFFQAAGIGTQIGFDGFVQLPPKQPGSPLSDVPHEADLLLMRLAASGINVPSAGKGRAELPTTAADHEKVTRWLSDLPSDGGRPWIGIGPGSKMPSKIWPRERYAEVVGILIREFDVWPVVFGGPEDHETAEWLLQGWQRGFNAAGALGLRPALAALTRARLYLGNDTGTMHLAVAAGVRCVVPFSARAHPGQWYPYGVGHTVFRESIDCEGCQLVTCVAQANACLTRISSGQVLEAARRTLKETLGLVST